MNMLDALSGSKAKPKPRFVGKPRFAWTAVIAVVVVCLGAAIPKMSAAKQDSASALEEVLTSGKKSKDTRTIVESTQARLRFSKNISDRIAVGNEDLVKLTVLNKREIMLYGAKVGRTSITVWFEDQTIEQYMFSVQRDLSILEAALKNISPAITVEVAPDRDALVLTGTVPDSSHALRAEQVALQYISAGDSKGQKDLADVRNTGQVINLIQVQNPGATMEARMQAELARLGARNVAVRRVNQGLVPSDLDDVFILEGMVDDIRMLIDASSLAAKILPGADMEAKRERVVNRLTTKDGRAGIEGVIERAIHDLGYSRVRVRSVANGEFPGDGDILVLEGRVPTQTALLHTLALASKVFLQQELVKDKQEKRNIVIETDVNGNRREFERILKLPDSNEDLRVVGDESGGLKSDRIDFFGGTSGSALGGILGASGGGQEAGGGFLKVLSNQLGTNIGRAKALEIANGRILSLLTVDDLPQVRIDIRLYEVNRTALLSWNSAQSAKVTDFDQPSTLETPPNASNDADFQNTVSFLGGALLNNFQVSGDHVDIDSLFSLLETEGIARRLSNPSLTVLSGELAFFGVGGTVPIESSFVTDFGSGVGEGANSGVLNTTTERPFGVSLSVRPLVAEDDMITLDVIPSVSNPDPELTRVIRESTGTDPSTVAFQERALRTSARLRDGQTLLVGGLTERTRKDDSSQTPGLHEIPIIGWLFKGFSYEDDDRELVIVVNPVIIRDKPKSAPIWAFPDLSELTKKHEPAPAPAEPEDSHSRTGGQ